MLGPRAAAVHPGGVANPRLWQHGSHDRRPPHPGHRPRPPPHVPPRHARPDAHGASRARRLGARGPGVLRGPGPRDHAARDLARHGAPPDDPALPAVGRGRPTHGRRALRGGGRVPLRVGAGGAAGPVASPRGAAGGGGPGADRVERVGRVPPGGRPLGVRARGPARGPAPGYRGARRGGGGGRHRLARDPPAGGATPHGRGLPSVPRLPAACPVGGGHHAGDDDHRRGGVVAP